MEMKLRVVWLLNSDASLSICHFQNALVSYEFWRDIWILKKQKRKNEKKKFRVYNSGLIATGEKVTQEIVINYDKK